MIFQSIFYVYYKIEVFCKVVHYKTLHLVCHHGSWCLRLMDSSDFQLSYAGKCPKSVLIVRRVYQNTSQCCGEGGEPGVTQRG